MAPFYAKLGPDRQWIRVVGQLLQKNEVRPHLIYHQFRVGRSKGLLDHYPELVILKDELIAQGIAEERDLDPIGLSDLRESARQRRSSTVHLDRSPAIPSTSSPPPLRRLCQSRDPPPFPNFTDDPTLYLPINSGVLNNMREMCRRCTCQTCIHLKSTNTLP
ncbi:hypothetical protein Fcan01_01821 [Folsomia candida]|uniref:Uncharacterized protein n=1 Tax=Folsomia candida TaxID=158441 RepID=A0A226EYW0_FOLCA|nr:hypothetical protein Fcan01_01821 [Folsomia candida]